MFAWFHVSTAAVRQSSTAGLASVQNHFHEITAAASAAGSPVVYSFAWFCPYGLPVSAPVGPDSMYRMSAALRYDTR
jgi:hypothetical protein